MDKQKADQIITEYFHRIYGFSIKKCYSYEEAKELCAEIVQEVYLSLFKAKEVINVEGYIWRISEHTYAKYVSSQKKHEGISIDGLDIPIYDDYVLEDPDDEIRKLRLGLAFLTEKRRRIVYRFYYEALEYAMMKAKNYPPQMQALVISYEVNKFISFTTAIMTMDILYKDGTFKPLTENERTTSNLILFSDVLPTA